jgi:hypothetical protein
VSSPNCWLREFMLWPWFACRRTSIRFMPEVYRARL